VLVDERALKGALAAAIEQITALARTAVGADSERGDRVEVRSIPFFQAPVEVVAEPPALIRWRPTTRVWIGLGASGALVVLLIVALVIRSLRKQAILRPDLLTRGSSFPLPVRELESAIAASERASIGAQPLQLPTRPARDRALDAIRNDGARAAKVIAAWLDEDIQKESGA